MPIYTYRCPEGHTWDEVRSYEGSETSEGTCQHQATGPNHMGTYIPCGAKGTKVPATGVKATVKGGTPIHYPNRGAR